MYDSPHERVKKVSLTLECKPGSYQTQCEAMEGACPAEERPCSGRSLSALGYIKIAFRCLWHAIVVPPPHRGFTQVPWLRSARAMTHF